MRKFPCSLEGEIHFSKPGLEPTYSQWPKRNDKSETAQAKDPSQPIDFKEFCEMMKGRQENVIRIVHVILVVSGFHCSRHESYLATHF